MKATTPPHPLAAIATAIVFASYFVALHVLVVSRAQPFVLLVLVVAPWLVAGASVLMTGARITASIPVRALLLSILVAALAVAAWRFAIPLTRHVDLLLYLENLAFMGALTALFASSLRPGRDSLITRLARIARRGDMPPAVVRYTRRVTLVWALYFASIAVVSTLLFTTQSRTTWSAFVNLAIWPLTIALFMIEYAVRRLVLREIPHVPMMAGAQAFRRHARDKSS